MKKFIFLSLMLIGYYGYSQEDERFGVFLGLNQYYAKSNFLSSRSNMGYTAGAVATLPISSYSEILVEISLARFKSEFLGRESIESVEKEWIKMHMDRINLAVIYDYDVLHFFDEDLAIGINAGPSLAFIQDWRLDDQSKEVYLIEPYSIEPQYMMTDAYNEKVSLNIYVEFGMSVRYRNLEGSLRYYKGITSPYRNFPLSSSMLELKGKDDYSTFTVTYYFGNNF